MIFLWIRGSEDLVLRMNGRPAVGVKGFRNTSSGVMCVIMRLFGNFLDRSSVYLRVLKEVPDMASSVVEIWW